MAKKPKKTKKKHLSLSEVQEEAEAVALELIRSQHGYGSLERRKVDVGQGSVQPDGVNSTGGKIVEIYARVGTMKGSQPKKVATDILKLATIRKQPGFENARCEIYFVDAAAMDSIRGWIKEAASQFGIGLKLVPDFPDELIERLLVAQEKQAVGATKRKKS